MSKCSQCLRCCWKGVQPKYKQVSSSCGVFRLRVMHYRGTVYAASLVSHSRLCCVLRPPVRCLLGFTSGEQLTDGMPTVLRVPSYCNVLDVPTSSTPASNAHSLLHASAHLTGGTQSVP